MMDHNMSPFDLPLAGSVLGELAVTVPILTAAMRMRKLGKQVPSVPSSRFPSIYKKVGINPTFPTYETPKLSNNAAYVHPGDAKKYLDLLGAKYPAKDAKRISRMGAIMYGPGEKKPYIIAHEAGHASVANRGGLPAFNQRHLRTAGMLLNALSVPAAAMFGSYAGSPIIGAGAGLAAGLVTGLPSLINEYHANKAANRYLLKPGLSPTIRNTGQSALRTAYSTYLSKAMIPATVSGAFGGAMGMMN